MIRPLISLLIALAAAAAGHVVLAFGSFRFLSSMSTGFGAFDGGALALIVVGALLLGIGALSLAVHWLGPLVLGVLDLVLGLLALVLPFGSILDGGGLNPIFQFSLTVSFGAREIADGLHLHYFTGTAFLIGAFLVAAALAVRARRRAPVHSGAAVVAAAVLGVVVLLGAALAQLLAGGAFSTRVFRMFDYDLGLALAAASAGVLAAIGGAMLRWSSVGAVIAGTLTTIAGIVLLLDPARLGPAFPGWLVAGYGLVLVAGLTMLAAGIASRVRLAAGEPGMAPVPEAPGAL